MTPTERTRLRREHQRGSYDPQSIYDILDATTQCSVGYTIDAKPYVTPTFHWREGNHVYWHGSSASRMLRKATDAEVCLSVQIIDGYVMARSAFHHSANYRSATLFGRAFKVPEEEKAARLDAFVEHLWPGRTEVLRPMQPQEIKATTILGLEITEASAKARSGPPIDDDADYGLPIWAGIIPMTQVVGAPIADPHNLPDLAAPDHIINFTPDRTSK